MDLRARQWSVLVSLQASYHNVLNHSTTALFSCVYDCPGTNPSGSQPLPSADRLLDVSFIDFINLQLELSIVSQMPLTFVAEKEHSNKMETMTLNVHKKRVISPTIRGW